MLINNYYMHNDESMINENITEQEDNKTGKEVNFDELFQSARKMNKYETLSDFDLKQKLIDTLFTNNTSSDVMSDYQNDTNIIKKNDQKDTILTKTVNPNVIKAEQSVQDNFLKPEHIQKNINLEKSKPSYTGQDFQAKTVFKKQQFIAKIKEDLIPISESSLISALLFKLSKDIKAYSNGKFWGINHCFDEGFNTFREKISEAYYKAETNIFLQIWHFIRKKKKENIELSDPIKNINFYPEPNETNQFGSEFSKKNSLQEPWFALLFGFSGSKQKKVTVENSHFFSLSKIISELSTSFDEIFTLSQIRFAENKKTPRRDENLLFTYISESFLPVIKIFRVIDHIAFSTQPGHQAFAKTDNLVYFIGWCHVKWIHLLEKTLNDIQHHNTPDGKTGTTSLNEILNTLKKNVNESLQRNNYDGEELEYHLSQRDAIFSRIDFYVQIIPEIKKRLRFLMSYLFGNVIFGYLSEKKLFLEYTINEEGHIIYKNLNRVESPIDKEDTPEDIEHETKMLKAQLKVDVSEETEQDKSGLIKKTGDLIIILTSIATAFNENFEIENQFTLGKNTDENRYDYLKSKEYFNENAGIRFDKIKTLQDLYDNMFETKKFCIVIDQIEKNGGSLEDMNFQLNKLKEHLDILQSLFKDATTSLSVVSQNEDKLIRFNSLVDRFFSVYNDMKKLF